MKLKEFLLMYNKRLVPKKFIPPKKFEAEEFVFLPLTIHDLVRDFEAVMSSVKRLQGLMDDSKWPENLTIEDNLIDLGWHQREFTLGHSFAYSISRKGEKYLGCCYFYPSENTDFDVDIFYWIREDEPYEKLEKRLRFHLQQWVQSSWPFKKVNYPRRP